MSLILYVKWFEGWPLFEPFMYERVPLHLNKSFRYSFNRKSKRTGGLLLTRKEEEAFVYTERF